MVPWTAYAVLHNESLRKWSVIVAAMGIDREDFFTGPDQQNRLTADMAEQLSVYQL